MTDDVLRSERAGPVEVRTTSVDRAQGVAALLEEREPKFGGATSLPMS